MSSEEVIITGNPIITDVYTADPTVLVHDGTVYLYTGHDEAAPGVDRYVMRDWLCFSSTDLRDWAPHGPLLRATDFAWASGRAKASCVVERHGRFHWFVAVDHATVPGGAIGVAVADHPTGPFRDAIGAALVTNDMPHETGFDHTNDPFVLVHGGAAYLYWGKYRCYRARLDDTMTALAGPITEVELPDFEEGVHLHERDGLFYLAFGHRYPQRVAYATGPSPEGPWTVAGLVNEVPGNCATNRPAIVEVDGEWLFFYHNGVLPGGGSHRRSVCVDRLSYASDGAMERVHMTTEGLDGQGVALVSPRTGVIAVAASGARAATANPTA